MTPQSEQTKKSLPERWIDQLAISLSTSFGIGYIPWAPGTFGSLPGIFLGILLHEYLLNDLQRNVWSWQAAGVLISALTTLFIIAAWSIARTERVLQIHDDRRIVIDEVLGQAIASAFIPAEPLYLVSSFVLFRILDIRKPWLIGWIDRTWPGWYGTLCDDVLAGIVAALILYALYVLYAGSALFVA